MNRNRGYILRGIAVLAAFILIPEIDSEAFEPKGYNYDEAKVPAYTLPDPLIMEDGEKVTTAEMWTNKRRPEILSLFETQVFGKSPAVPSTLMFEETSSNTAMDGLAFRKEVTIWLNKEKTGPSFNLLVYLPAKNKKKSTPVFIGLNFYGNHSIADDPEITLSNVWMRRSKEKGIVNHRATEKSRGSASSRWPVKKILERGYGLVALYCGDMDPDYDDDFKNGIQPLFYKDGQTKPKEDEWGTIAAWTWGLSRAMDYFETDNSIDHKNVAVIGHSRLGKTSLWAGASDERFALVISNDSGCGGAALSRRAFGETVKRINTSFPHWFCDNFVQYNDNESKIPVDQHQLIALIAPRPVYVASAEEDRWADPKGEFLSAYHASTVYELLGKKPIASKEMPKVNEPITGDIGYHIRSGKHDVTDYDWDRYLDFADKHLKK